MTNFLLMKISNIEINDKWDNEGDNKWKEESRRWIFFLNPLNTCGVTGVVLLDFIDKVTFQGFKIKVHLF
jgi:hypothetical protein